MNARTTYPGGKWKELVYDATRAVTNILHTARSTPNTAFFHDAFGNVTNAVDTAGNSWLFSYASLNNLTNEVFTFPRLCDYACETNALARLIDAYSRPVGYDLAIGSTPCSRVRYGYDAEGRISTLAATNAANRGFLVTYLNEAGYNYGYTLTTPNGAILTRTVKRAPYRRSLTLDCTTRFNNVEVASFAYSFDAHNRPVARNNDRFAYNDRDEISGGVHGRSVVATTLFAENCVCEASAFKKGGGGRSVAAADLPHFGMSGPVQFAREIAAHICYTIVLTRRRYCR